MKKLIIAALLLITATQTFAGPIVSLSVEFGHRDANKNCVERGVCHITVGWSRDVTGSVDDNTGNLQITFEKASLAKNVAEAQFTNGIFEVPVACVLDADLCAKLGIDKFTIKAGKYKIIETATQYKIVFNK
ncbi:MAG: hypothetical protein ACJ77K_14440 [Bacteroidia bacterium]|jgi:hypothetical protein